MSQWALNPVPMASYTLEDAVRERLIYEAEEEERKEWSSPSHPSPPPIAQERPASRTKFGGGVGTRAYHYRVCLDMAPAKVVETLVSEKWDSDINRRSLPKYVNNGRRAVSEHGYCPHCPKQRRSI